MRKIGGDEGRAGPALARHHGNHLAGRPARCLACRLTPAHLPPQRRQHGLRRRRRGQHLAHPGLHGAQQHLGAGLWAGSDEVCMRMARRPGLHEGQRHRVRQLDHDQLGRLPVERGLGRLLCTRYRLDLERGLELQDLGPGAQRSGLEGDQQGLHRGRFPFGAHWQAALAVLSMASRRSVVAIGGRPMVRASSGTKVWCSTSTMATRTASQSARPQALAGCPVAR